MRVENIVESSPALIALDLDQVQALRASGRRLASSKIWWGAAQGQEPTGSVIHVSPHDEGLWSVRVNDAVGFVSAPGLQLVVQPKIPVTHFLYLFGLSGVLPRVDTGTLMLASGSSLLEVLVHWYVTALERVLRADLLKDYVGLREPLGVVRGTVHPLTTARSFLTGRIAIDCSHEDFLTDTPLNRLLKGAARAVEALTVVSRPARRRAGWIVARMDCVGDLRHTDLNVTLDRRSAFYAEAVALARMVLESTGLDWRLDDRAGRGFLIRTPEMVEAGLRAILQEEFGAKRIVKRPIPIAGSSLTLNPDIMAPEDHAVGDIKYKRTAPEWPRGDLYQVIAFAHASLARKAVVSTFSTTADHRLPTLTVGGTRITHIAWMADDGIPPSAARADWVSDFRKWLETVAPVDIMSYSSHSNS